MKSLLLVTILLVFALNASAQSEPGWFTLYTSYTTPAELKVCWIGQATGPVTVSVVYDFGSASAARFRLIPDPGLHWMYVSESPVFPYFSTGNVQDGVVIEGPMGSGGLPLMTVQYTALIPPDPCARLRIGPYPGSTAPTVETLTLGAWVTPTFVYDLFTEPCNESPWCILTPVENRTWGAVKALYR